MGVGWMDQMEIRLNQPSSWAIDSDSKSVDLPLLESKFSSFPAISLFRLGGCCAAHMQCCAAHMQCCAAHMQVKLRIKLSPAFAELGKIEFYRP